VAKKTAEAMISSLWEVNEASSGELMADFYLRWATGAGKDTKVETLRKAQLDLLLGNVKPIRSKRGWDIGFDTPKAPSVSRTPTTARPSCSWATGDEEWLPLPGGNEE